MAPSTVAEIRDRLAAARAKADGILSAEAHDARLIETSSEAASTALIEGRLAEIDGLRLEIEANSRRIDAAYASMVEALAETSMRLLEAARDADFRPPEWPEGLQRTLELKLSETREMTLRVPVAAAAGASDQ